MFESSPDNIGQYGKSSTNRLKKSFPGSPINLGKSDSIIAFNREGVRAWYTLNVIRGNRSDGGHSFGTFNMNYENAPKYEDVLTGGRGMPASPWVPNPTSPGDGNGVNPANQSEIQDQDYGREIPSTPFVGEGSNLSPNTSSKITVTKSLRNFLLRDN
jgi:hypothetical protein